MSRLKQLDVTALVTHVTDAYGRLDCAVNCAGVGGGDALTADYPQDRWDRIVDVNLRGTFLVLRGELAAMTSVGSGGAIVNVASTLGLRGSANASAYSAFQARRARHHAHGRDRGSPLTASASTPSVPARSTPR